MEKKIENIFQGGGLEKPTYNSGVLLLFYPNEKSDIILNEARVDRYSSM